MNRRERMMENLDQDIRDFIELETQDNIERGMPPEEAHYAALRKFGNATRVKEDTWEVWSFGWLEQLWQDLRYGLRTLRKSPAYASVAVLALALGISATTTIFSVINATLLNPLPFRQPDRLVLIWETSGKAHDNWNAVSAPNFWDFERQSKSFERMAISDGGRGYNVSPTIAKHEAEQVFGLRVSASFFSVLGVKPFLGRSFLPEEETLGKNHEVVLRYGLWKRRYGGDRALVGRTIMIDGEKFTVVGVMPRQFQWQFWNPSQLCVLVGYTKSDYQRDWNNFVVIARLKPRVTLSQARAEMLAIANRLAQGYPTEDVGMGTWIVPLGEFARESLRVALLALLVAVGFVLLIACVNVANLLLARGAPAGAGNPLRSGRRKDSHCATAADRERAACFARGSDWLPAINLEFAVAISCLPA